MTYESPIYTHTYPISVQYAWGCQSSGWALVSVSESSNEVEELYIRIQLETLWTFKKVILDYLLHKREFQQAHTFRHLVDSKHFSIAGIASRHALTC